jgi:hypothetical protein
MLSAAVAAAAAKASRTAVPTVVLPPMTPRCRQAGRRRSSATATATLPAAATALPASFSYRCCHCHSRAVVALLATVLPPMTPHCRQAAKAAAATLPRYRHSPAAALPATATLLLHCYHRVFYFPLSSLITHVPLPSSRAPI